MIARAEIVAAARGWIGTPYRHQASLKGVGCDCLGLVRGVWRELYGEEPGRLAPYASDWAVSAQGEPLLDAARRLCVAREPQAIAPGDVLLFRWRARLPASHLGVAVTATTMIHAHDGACVAEAPIHESWRRRLAGVFALPGVVG